MPKYRVSGDIVAGAYSAIVEASNPDEAAEIVQGHRLDDESFFEGVSYEKAFAVVENVEPYEGEE
jgi:hypothetical protein